MAQYIDKDALVAEIERRMQCYSSEGCEPNAGKWVELISIEHFLNTLEVKEVDLEKIIEQTYHDRSVTDTADMDHVTYENIAKYFFELGLKAQNYNSKCKDLGDDGTCMYAANKTGKVMHCENIICSRKIKAQKGE